MRQTIEATGTVNIPVSVKVGTIFSWATLFAIVMNLKNRLPEPWQDVIPVNNVDDLKTSVRLIAILMGSFLIAGLYDTILMAEGGAL